MTLGIAPGVPADYLIADITEHETYYACPVCNTPALKESQETLEWKGSVYCVDPECMRNGERTYFSSVQARMIVRPGYEDLVEDPTTGEHIQWYHISHTSPDEMEFDSWLSMHIGQADTVKNYYDISFSHGDDFYVYRLRFRDNVTVSPKLIDDFDDWEDVEISFENEAPVDAYCYVNRLEAPGSISMITRRDVIEVVEVYEHGCLPEEILNADA